MSSPVSLKAIRIVLARLVIAATLMLGVAGCWLAPASAGAAEAGVNLSSLSPSGVRQASALGVHWIRVFANWSYLEPGPGVHAANWFAEYDRLLDSLPKGTKVIMDLVSTPSWESGSSASNAPPRDPADYGNLLHFIAQRWAGKVAAYEIWNEEDAPLWWAGGPDPAAYTRLLQTAYTAVKSAEPNAAVVLGGLTGNDYNFLQGVYQAGGKGYFDAVGVHTDTACNTSSPYLVLRDADGRLDPDSFLGYREVHATELANGDDKPIWMTETSWRTTTATCAEGAFAGRGRAGVSDAEQATYLTEAYHCLAKAPYVQLALWFPIADEGEVTSGLLRVDLAHKPAYAALRSVAEHGDRAVGSCGDFAGPKITLMDPTRDQRYTGRLKIKVKASDAQGIERIRLLYDGHLIRNFDPYAHLHVFPRVAVGEMHWFGARKIAVGQHTLTIIAIDKLGNVTRTNRVIVHLREAPKHHRVRRR
jgi:Cellulase (glycosyl hydrolase family 5)